MVEMVSFDRIIVVSLAHLATALHAFTATTEHPQHTQCMQAAHHARYRTIPAHVAPRMLEAPPAKYFR